MGSNRRHDRQYLRYALLISVPLARYESTRIAILFTGVSAVTMSVWALKKQRNYQREFGKEYPKGRKAIIPFIL